MQNGLPDLLRIREALEVSWEEKTSYRAVQKAGNPALGQCYPTARVLQFFFPQTEIVKGSVQTDKGLEIHFWNLLEAQDVIYHIDLSWQQFPVGSSVKEFKILHRHRLGDGVQTIARVEFLKQRVTDYLALYD